jgi:hypothetical protein
VNIAFLASLLVATAGPGGKGGGHLGLPIVLLLVVVAVVGVAWRSAVRARRARQRQ